MPKFIVFLFAIVSVFALGPPALAQVLPSAEDLHSLSVNRKDFSSPSIVDAGVQSQPGFTRQLLQVMWRPGDPIDLYIVRPENIVKPPVVIFLYTWPDDGDRFHSDAWCRNITKHGFAAVGFVSALTGQRYHDRPWKETFVSELPEALVKTSHDVQLLIDYLSTRPDLDASRIGILGQGSGGTIALLAASVDLRIKAIDVIDPWGNWPKWFDASPIIPDSERPYFTDPRFLTSVAIFDPLAILPKLAKRNLRLEQTTIDASTPETAREAIHHALPTELDYTLYTSEQDYRSRAMKDGQILSWLQGKLSQP